MNVMGDMTRVLFQRITTQYVHSYLYDAVVLLQHIA